MVRNLFIGDVVFGRTARAGHLDELAYLVRVRAAWKRALPQYVVVWTYGYGCGVHLDVGSRNLFAFSFDGHAGLDRRPERQESDAHGWAWWVSQCGTDFNVCGLCNVESGQDGYFKVNDFDEVSRPTPGPKKACRGDWPQRPDRKTIDRREREVVADLTRAIGPPLPPPTPASAAEFESFAAAHVGVAGLPPWPEHWEYAAAAVLQCARLLGTDHASEAWVESLGPVVFKYTWDWWEAMKASMLLAQGVAEATVLPRPALLWKAFGDGVGRFVRDVQDLDWYAPDDLTTPRFVQVKVVRSAQLLLQLPRNWRTAHLGMVPSWDIEQFIDCRRAVTPSLPCAWIHDLMERHQAALDGLAMAYIRHAMVEAGAPWIDGKAAEVPQSQQQPP